MVISSMLSGCGQEGRTTTGGAGGGPSSGSTTSSTASGSGAGGGTAEPESIRLVNWNTRNFLNDVFDSDAPQEETRTTAAYQAQRVAVGEVLEALDPDVVVFAEVENQAVLDDLADTELGGAYPGRAVSDGNDPRGINVAALSRVPFDAVVSHAGDKFPVQGTTGPLYGYARDCLELHLTWNGRQVILLAVHFKAKSDSDPTQADKRLAEAQNTRALADALAVEHPEAVIAILGDYNDLPGSPPVEAVAGAEPSLFTDVAAQAPENDRWTFEFQGALELIDHQMVNGRFLGMLEPGSVVIEHGAAVSDASDHAPVSATYLVN
jgi:endonuclease/exonuclease/phosphatase family metal-dependent hydrolase